MINWLLQLPTWPIIRVAGIASFCLLTIGMALGISYNFKVWPRGSKPRIYRYHSYCTIAGTAIGLLHGVFTVIDTYTPYSWSDLLLPFSSGYAPVLSGIGTLSGYGMLLLILTTDLRNKLKRPVWLMFHMLSYPIYMLALIHGFFLGSDSDLPGIRLLYAASLILLIGLTAARNALSAPRVPSVSSAPAKEEPQVIILPPSGRTMPMSAPDAPDAREAEVIILPPSSRRRMQE